MTAREVQSLRGARPYGKLERHDLLELRCKGVTAWERPKYCQDLLSAFEVRWKTRGKMGSSNDALDGRRADVRSMLQVQEYGKKLLLEMFGEQARGMLENPVSSAWEVLVTLLIDLEDQFWLNEDRKDGMVWRLGGKLGFSRADMTWRELERAVGSMLKHRPELAGYLTGLMEAYLSPRAMDPPTLAARPVASQSTPAQPGEQHKSVQGELLVDLEGLMEACGKHKSTSIQATCDEMLILAATADNAAYYELRKQLGKQRLTEEQRGSYDKHRDRVDAVKAMQDK